MGKRIENDDTRLFASPVITLYFRDLRKYPEDLFTAKASYFISYIKVEVCH